MDGEGGTSATPAVVGGSCAAFSTIGLRPAALTPARHSCAKSPCCAPSITELRSSSPWSSWRITVHSELTAADVSRRPFASKPTCATCTNVPGEGRDIIDGMMPRRFVGRSSRLRDEAGKSQDIRRAMHIRGDFSHLLCLHQIILSSRISRRQRHRQSGSQIFCSVV